MLLRLSLSLSVFLGFSLLNHSHSFSYRVLLFSIRAEEEEKKIAVVTTMINIRSILTCVAVQWLASASATPLSSGLPPYAADKSYYSNYYPSGTVVTYRPSGTAGIFYPFGTGTAPTYRPTGTEGIFYPSGTGTGTGTAPTYHPTGTEGIFYPSGTGTASGYYPSGTAGPSGSSSPLLHRKSQRKPINAARNRRLPCEQGLHRKERRRLPADLEERKRRDECADPAEQVGPVLYDADDRSEALLTPQVHGLHGGERRYVPGHCGEEERLDGTADLDE